MDGTALLILSVQLLIFLAPSPSQCSDILTPIIDTGLHPMVVIPGQSGNQLEARLTAAYRPSQGANCRAKRKKGWFRLWLNYTALHDPTYVRCFAEHMSLVWDPANDDFRNADGVETRAPFFGSTRSFLYRDPEHKDQFVYMARLVEYLEGIGYRDGKNLFGAPYDFRYGLPSNGHPSRVGAKYLANLKRLIEIASVRNQNKPVILLAHSYGGLLALNFLNRTPMAWRKKFVKHFIALSTPWGGTVIEMRIFASGSSLGFPFIDPLALRHETRSLESGLWLLPSPKVFGDAPLVITKCKNYSACGIVGFLGAIGYSAGIRPYVARILPLVQDLAPAPRVPMTCMTGFGVETEERLVFGEGEFDVALDVVYGDGDGLVNLASLLALESEWLDESEQELNIIKIANVSHEGILKDDFALRRIIREVHEVNTFSLRSPSK